MLAHPCGCFRAPRAASPARADDEDRSCTTRGSPGRGNDSFKPTGSIGSSSSEESHAVTPNAYPRLMANAAKAVGMQLGTRNHAARGMRDDKPWLVRLLDLNPQRLMTKAKSFESRVAADTFGWNQFMSMERIAVNPLDQHWQASLVRVIKINITKDNKNQKDAVKELLRRRAHFPGSIHTVELTGCDIAAVPEALAGHGDLRALRLTDNKVAKLPKGWLGPERRAQLAARSQASEGSRVSSLSPLSWWRGRTCNRSLSPSTRGRSLSPSIFSSPGGARARSPCEAGPASGPSAQGGSRERSRERSRGPAGIGGAASPPPAEGNGAGLPGDPLPREHLSTREAQSPTKSALKAQDLSPREHPSAWEAQSPIKSALKAKDATSPGRTEKRKVTLPADEVLKLQLPPRGASPGPADGASKSPGSAISRRSIMSRASSWLSRDRHPKPRQPQLEELRLDRNSLGWIERGALSGAIVKDLRVLNLGHNHLNYLPEGFLEGAVSLHLLDLSNNHLERVRLAESLLGKESCLEVLLLDSNRLETLPARLPRSLRRLGVSYNQLKELPKDIGKCTKLESVRMASNMIRFLPLSMLDLWPGKRMGGRLAELQVAENPLIQPSITAFQMGGLDAAFELFEKWAAGTEAPYQPPEPAPPVVLPPLWAVSLESLRFPGFFLDVREETQLHATPAEPVVPGGGGGGGGRFNLRLREYAGGVVSLEGARSRGLLVSARGADREYREVCLAPARPEAEAACHFRVRAFPGGLVTFESLCFPGFFLNVYGTDASQKYVQLVPEEPNNPESQPWGFLRAARVRLPAEPLLPPGATEERNPRFAEDEEDDWTNTVSSVPSKRFSIRPMTTIMRGLRSMRGIASMRAAHHVNSLASGRVAGVRGRSPQPRLHRRE